MSTIASELTTILETKEQLRLAINKQGNNLSKSSPLSLFPQGIKPVDTEMSDSSENLVQNKVIKNYIDTKFNDVNIDVLGTFTTVVELPTNGTVGNYYFKERLEEYGNNNKEISNDATSIRRLVLSNTSRD